MNRTDTILLTVAIGLVLGMTTLGFLFFRDPAMFVGEDKSPVPVSTPESESEAVSTPTDEPTGQVEVTYSDQAGFIPKTVTIKTGQTVAWVNNRERRPMWVASDPHPIHDNYQAFDTARVLGRFPEMGEGFSFTFEKPGTWTYHDHADPSKTGTVIVK